MSDTNDFVCFEEELINLSFDLLSSVEYTQRKLGENTTKIQKSDSHCGTCCTFRWGGKGNQTGNTGSVLEICSSM